MDIPFFSIIIPVFQVEKYLPECIKSVQSQVFDDYEAILIDDGSTDKSGDICDAAAATDSRFCVIHQINSGLSGARNTGINAARGKYLIFLDSDDMLQGDALINIFTDLQAYDVDVWCGGCNFFPKEQHPGKCFSLPVTKNVILNGSNALIKMFNDGTFFAAACLNICKRETILRKKLFFKEKMLHEDEEWTPRMLLAIDKVCCSPRAFYIYRQRTGSIVSTLSSKRLYDCCCYGLDLVKMLRSGKIPSACHNAFYRRAANFWMMPLLNQNYSRAERIKVFRTCCKQYPAADITFLMKSSPKWKYLSFIASLLKTTCFCYIFYYYINFRVKFKSKK